MLHHLNLKLYFISVSKRRKWNKSIEYIIIYAELHKMVV